MRPIRVKPLLHLAGLRVRRPAAAEPENDEYPATASPRSAAANAENCNRQPAAGYRLLPFSSRKDAESAKKTHRQPLNHQLSIIHHPSSIQGLPAAAFLPISPEEVPDPFNSPDGRDLQGDLDDFADSGGRAG